MLCQYTREHRGGLPIAQTGKRIHRAEALCSEWSIALHSVWDKRGKFMINKEYNT